MVPDKSPSAVLAASAACGDGGASPPLMVRVGMGASAFPGTWPSDSSFSVARSFPFSFLLLARAFSSSSACRGGGGGSENPAAPERKSPPRRRVDHTSDERVATKDAGASSATAR